ncbi:DUF4249 family protein [Roseimarinus sediminis]|jgi:hypothetical protein|uniref:DUF4249 family protein n=1 Tax=Roseimarinus sediminis TaxID=1610899 RepID=UPI003D24B178
MKKISYILFVLWTCACNNTVSFDFPEDENLIYCNALFSPDQYWQATIGYTYSFSGNSLDSRIENALVFITDENNDTIYLNHNKMGEYISESQKPEEGVAYRIFVVIENDTLKSSESRIPDDAAFDIIEMNEDRGNVQFDLYTLSEVYELKCRLNISGEDVQGIMIRNLIFDDNSGRGISYYAINEEVLKAVSDSTGNTVASDKLRLLKGDTIYSYDDFSEMVIRLAGSYLNETLIYYITEASYAGTSIVSNEHTRIKTNCYSAAPQFVNFGNENYTLLGNFHSSADFDIYVWDFLTGDYWLDVKILSPEAFAYYNDLITQYSSRIDQHSIQHPVYSNIANGTGIFAGYKQQLIHYVENN